MRCALNWLSLRLRYARNFSLSYDDWRVRSCLSVHYMKILWQLIEDKYFKKLNLKILKILKFLISLNKSYKKLFISALNHSLQSAPECQVHCRHAFTCLQEKESEREPWTSSFSLRRKKIMQRNPKTFHE